MAAACAESLVSSQATTTTHDGDITATQASIRANSDEVRLRRRTAATAPYRSTGSVLVQSALSLSRAALTRQETERADPVIARFQNSTLLQGITSISMCFPRQIYDARTPGTGSAGYRRSEGRGSLRLRTERISTAGRG